MSLWLRYFFMGTSIVQLSAYSERRRNLARLDYQQKEKVQDVCAIARFLLKNDYC